MERNKTVHLFKKQTLLHQTMASLYKDTLFKEDFHKALDNIIK